MDDLRPGVIENSLTNELEANMRTSQEILAHV